MAFQPLGEFNKEKFGEKPRVAGYYCVVPHYILEDPKISSTAKLIYGEISSLANKFGYCYATNKHFCKLLGLKTNTIQKAIVQLKEAKYIRVEVSKKSDGTRRKIWICPKGGIKDYMRGV